MKTKTTHTPGPWEVSNEGAYDGFPFVLGWEGNNCKQVADLRQSEFSAETQEANARLIAAAPGLLTDEQENDAAFDQILATLTTCGDWGKNDELRRRLVDFVGEKREKTRAAILRAEGK